MKESTLILKCIKMQKNQQIQPKNDGIQKVQGEGAALRLSAAHVETRAWFLAPT